MHRIILSILIAVSIPVLAVENKSEAQYTIEVLDAFCIQNQTDFDNIVPMAVSAGGKILPNEQADPAMRELGGKTVYVPYNGRNYIVAFANEGGCTVVTKTIDLANLKSLLVKYFKIEQIDRQSSLSQVNEMYEVKEKGIYQGAVLSIVYAQIETGYTEGSISFLPAAIINRDIR